MLSLRYLIGTMLITFSIASCGQSVGSDRYVESSSGSNGIDEGEATERPVDDLSGETYGSMGAPYGCTDDCSGHEAGFEWAKENEITDGDCYTESESFNEGCRAYGDSIEERAEEYEDNEAGLEEN